MNAQREGTVGTSELAAGNAQGYRFEEQEAPQGDPVKITTVSFHTVNHQRQVRVSTLGTVRAKPMDLDGG